MIRDLIVNLSPGDLPDPAAEFAVSAAAFLGAHVLGVSFRYAPVIPAMDLMPIPAEFIDLQREESEQLSISARTRFEELARRHALSIETRVLDETQLTAPEMFARAARRFDLSVVSQPRPDNPGEAAFVEAALFSSGRPVLVVPYIQRERFKLDRVMVCWDGSRAAARATADAVPLLARAGMTEVVTITDASSVPDVAPGTDIARHLVRHEIKVELKRIAAGDIDAGNVILSHAADTAVDLIVMGGYGHSRWREFILGGVTRALLASMTVPTFMSH
jgi:nucleotide-binding universal stress UspA family protein